MPDEKKTALPPKRCECDGCKKKLTLTSFPCHCNKYFCPDHRLSELHNCTYDYKAQHKKELLKFMSTPVIADKVTVI